MEYLLKAQKVGVGTAKNAAKSRANSWADGHVVLLSLLTGHIFLLPLHNSAPNSPFGTAFAVNCLFWVWFGDVMAALGQCVSYNRRWLRLTVQTGVGLSGTVCACWCCQVELV